MNIRFGIIGTGFMAGQHAKNLKNIEGVEVAAVAGLTLEDTAGFIAQQGLAARLQQGDLLAALDVFEQEPLPADSPLRALPNTFLTPHRAGGLIASVQRNIDWLIADLDHVLGCYGHPAVYSPNIDRLAARGTRFANTFCPYPLCGPSRTAMLTGQRPESFSMPNNEVAWRDLRPDLRTLPQRFREAGYTTAGFGKIFHHGIQAKDLDAWRAAHPDAFLPHTYADPPSWEVSDGTEFSERQAQGPECVLDGRPHGGTSLHTIRVTNPEVLPDTLNADRAIEFLKNLKSEISDSESTAPFFLGLGLHKPHVPLIAPEKWWAFYDSLPDAQIDALMGPTAGTPATLPPGTLMRDRFHRGATPEQRRHLYRGYLACVSWMDEQVGRVLAALEAAGLADNTLISFVADHGYHIGQQGQWDKMMLLDPALHIPLILAGPGIPAGRVVSAVTESLDLFPTLCELHGIDPQQPTAGKSLVPWLKEPAKSAPRPAFAWVQAGPREGWTLRTDLYRYGLTSREGADPEPYLFDLKADPHETTNLLAHGAQHPAAPALDTQLRRHFVTIH